MAAEKSSSKGQAWFCTTGLPSDIVIEVDDMNFHLHKFPLISRSRKLHQLIAEQETNQISNAVREREDEEDGEESEPERDEIEELHCQISLPDFPGGSEAFEMAAKFCYGVKVDLTSSTVVPLRCAGEFLEMTDEYCEDNLISKTERFLSQSVLKSLKESIKALKSCEKVMPLAETLGIEQRCINSVASRASSADPAIFGWPVSDGLHETRSTSNQALWNGIESAVRRKGAASATAAAIAAAGCGGANADSWFEHLAILKLPLFDRVILAMRERDLSPEIVESCLMHYAKKHIPGISRLNRKPSSSSSIASESEQRQVLETIISNLPLQKSSRSSTATRFLFGLLRTANILNASESCRSALEKKIGSQLEQATLDDLLIPSYSYLNETLYDVDCLERILGYFMDGVGDRNSDGIETEEDDHNVRSPTLMLVGKLIDGYLAEIASDANLKPDKFFNLAISLPEQARLFDDGLYRAVDVYLKAHPWIAEAEREKICGVMDCQKLTLEACTHAAQNERLPLRAVVQVLFFEQLQLRHAIAGTLIAAEHDPARPSMLRLEHEELENEGAITAAAEAGAPENSNTWRSAVRENQVLRLDMDSMRTRVHQLEKECSTMKKVIEKIDKDSPPPPRGWRGSLTKKLGCKFKPQVCDSHEQTVINGRKGREHHHSK
ncbi:BTB/POZ domain-containing protein At5g66560 [Euphorbia lathyris]|uniref:BTB/POZ domain-containing protein At5g66560 n=1 Tax=Euphorbia lathyris TaxID=212925 RepID=UPI00331401F5